MSARRVLRAGGLYFDGRSALAVVQPFTVYGWKEITIAEWVYPYWPKVRTVMAYFSMIGDLWYDGIATLIVAGAPAEYPYLRVDFRTRKPDGTSKNYSYDITGYRNSWVHLVRRFKPSREFSVWVNGEKKYSVTIPTEEVTVLERNPDDAPYPLYYKRFTLGGSTRFDDRMRVAYSEICIYNRALTTDEVRAIYERGALIRDGLVLHLDFSEGEGNIAYDKSGCGNHATIYGARWVVKKPLRVLQR
ncbi:MAG: LamG-like jellyroll fold domain-containing protein [Thermofilaceae archaeon]